MTEYILFEGRKFVPEQTEPVQAVRYFRQPYDIEIVNYNIANEFVGRVFRGDGVFGGPVRQRAVDNNVALPAVFRAHPDCDHQTPLDCSWQYLIRDMNKMFSLEMLLKIYSNTLAWFNRTGLPGRKNCLTGDLMNDPSAKWPAFDAARFQGGQLLKPKRIENGIFYVDNLRTSEPAPSAEFVLARPWLWFYGTTIRATKEHPFGVAHYMTFRGTDGNYHPIRLPNVSRLEVFVPLNWLDELPATFDPTNYDSRQFSRAA